MISNPGYEVPAAASTPGVAANWGFATSGSLEETAEFAGDTEVSLAGYETFDYGWGAVDPEMLVDDLVDLLVEKRTIERFERLWPRVNSLGIPVGDQAFQGFFFLTALEASVYDAAAQSFEDFENLWGSPIDLDMLLTITEVASVAFDGDAQEDFEDAWGSAAFTLGSTAAISFDAGGLSDSAASPSAAEKFTLKVRQRVQSDVGANKLGSVNPPLLLAVGDAITLVVESGSLPEPLEENTTYVVESIASNAVTLAAFAGASVIDITVDGSGANYVVADPGRFWLDEL